MSLWIWLSHRFGSERFPGLENVAEQSETLIELMNKGLQQMCELNKGPRRRFKRLTAHGKSIKYNAPLLEAHDPLAMAYLADVSNQKYIYNYEWSDSSSTQAASIGIGMPKAAKQLQAA